MAEPRRCRSDTEPEGVTCMNESELAARTAELPDIFADRVPEGELDSLRSMAEGGEWDELLDLLLSILRQKRATVSIGERDNLREVLAGWGVPTSQLDELVIGQ